MAGLFFVYALSGISGIVIERRLVLNSLLKRSILVSAAAAAQIVLCVQVLSLGKKLSGVGLVLANLALTAAAVGVLGLRTVPPPARIPWPALFSRSLSELRSSSKDPTILALSGVSTIMFFTACLAGWFMIPFGDCYHLEMPLFWMQNHSILPFAVPNPRIVALSFLNEALQLPGFLYLRSPVMASMFTFLPGLLALGAVFSLARRIGADFKASICAAAVTAGYTRFALDPLYASGEGFWAAAWFGASLIFLLDAHPRDSEGKFWIQNTSCSVFCFTMACGAKNTTVLLTPLYIFVLFIILRPRIGKQNPFPLASVPVIPMRSRKGFLAALQPTGTLRGGFLILFVSGTAGLLCSGVLWNYVTNTIWFGNSRGPTVISHTVSSDFRPGAVWTRLCRGAVLMLYDTIWVPRTAQNGYVHLCQSTVKALGGQQVLREDDDYSSFKTKELTPRKGLGLLGIGFYLPGVALALSRLLSNDRKASTPSAQLNIAVLLFMTFGSFVMCHLILRWQPIGLLRLMYPFVIAGAPLSALLLGFRWLRITSLGLLAVSAAMFFVFWAGHVSRRMGWVQRPSLKLIARLQNEHGLNVHYQWRDKPTCELQMHEDYTYREIFEKLMDGIRQPCTIGFVGNSNSECDFLFGRKFQNRVIPLVDSRLPTRIVEPPVNLDYLVALDDFSASRAWAEAHGFVEIFTATDGEHPMMIAFGKKPSLIQSEAAAAAIRVPHS